MKKIREYVVYLPALFLLVGMLLLYFTDLSQFFTFETIKQKHAIWVSYVQTHPFLSALYFNAIYILSVYFIIPDSIILSILAGFLFPLPLSILYICFSETIGAIFFFLTAEVTYKKLYEKYRPLDRLPSFFRSRLNDKKYQAPFLLFFRLSHLLPFWIINLCAACLSVSLTTFIWTTLVGVLPLAIVLAEGGSHLSHYMTDHTTFSIFTFLDTTTRVYLVLIALVALVPLLWKRR